MSTPRSKLFFYICLTIIFVVILVVFFITIYESMTGSKIGKTSLMSNPEIISVIIGLLLSLLFVERYKSLESQVRKLSEGPIEALKNIQEFTKQEIEQVFASVESKAQTLSANISGIIEKHPWLEVITEREFIVETDSCRGILRTCYTLLQDEKYLHLFEYLEYCSIKGTPQDKSKKTSLLKGTADDFFELSVFCETWLGDYYLSSVFLKRYIEQYPDSAYVLLPDYIRKLIRIGDLKSANDYSTALRRKVFGDDLYSRLRLSLHIDKGVSDRYKWLSANVLILTETIFNEDKRVEKYRKEIQVNQFSALFSRRQLFFNVEIQIQLGDFNGALEIIKEIESKPLESYELNELSYFFSKMGDFTMATELRDLVMDSYTDAFGDDQSNENTSKTKNPSKEKLAGKATNRSKDKNNTPPSPEQNPTPRRKRGGEGPSRDRSE